MPTYDYRCGACGHNFELRQGFEAEPVSPCPVCQKEARRVFHSPSIIYKGSGFYTTDYKGTHTSSPDSSTAVSSKDTASPKKESGAEKAGESKKESVSSEA